jgi:hypothetical protein
MDARAATAKKHPTKPMTELSKVMGDQWSKLSEKSKEKYQKQAAEDKARYEKEMARYKPSKAWLEAKAFLDEKKQRAKEKTPVRPRPKLPRTAFGDAAR